jgi:uncharacterized protein (TIGR04255 family)
MPQPRHLAHAPIQEAVIDIQFPAVEGVDLDAVASKFSPDGVATSFDVWQGVFEVQMDTSKGPQQLVTHNSSPGKRLDFADRGEVLQLRSNGFTFSKLPPYTKWETVRDTAIPLWERFVGELPPIAVSRIAVRYVNSFVLPLPIQRFEDYLNCGPSLPPGVGEGIASFLTRVVVPEGKDAAVITQSLEGEVQTDSGKGVKVLLDIDVAHVCKLPASDVGGLTTVLNRLRDFKNRAFFSLLTDAALEMFE